MLKNQVKVKMVLKEAILRDSNFEDFDVDSGKFSVEPTTVINWLNTSCYLFDLEFVGDGSKEWFIEQLCNHPEFGSNIEAERIKDASFTGKNVAIADYILAESVFDVIKANKDFITVGVKSSGLFLVGDVYNNNAFVRTNSGTIAKKDGGVLIETNIEMFTDPITTCANFMDLGESKTTCNNISNFNVFIDDLTTALKQGIIEWC